MARAKRAATKPATTPNPEIIEHKITEEDLLVNPELKEAGVEVGEIVGLPLNEKIDDPGEDQSKAKADAEAKAKAAAAKSKTDSRIESYRKFYPNEKAFHVTSDGQVFLKKDLQFAKEHQSRLNDGKEVETIEA